LWLVTLNLILSFKGYFFGINPCEEWEEDNQEKWYLSVWLFFWFMKVSTSEENA
jgi:hypothetical protein